MRRYGSRHKSRQETEAIVEVEGIVARQVGSHGYFAAVWLRHDSDHPNEVIVDVDAIGEYDRRLGWGEAAAFGAGLGISLSGASGAFVITHVRGMICDTSPTLVAIAAIRAIWIATEFSPLANLASRVESCVMRGHSLSLDDLKAELLAHEAEGRTVS